MPTQPGRRGVLPALLVALVVVGLGLTTYTQSVFNPGPAQTLEEVLQHALGDSLPSLPAYSAGRTGLEVTPGTTPVPSTPPAAADSAPVPSTPPAAADSAAAWVNEAVRRDSTAVRAWLSPLVLRWASRARDTVRLTFLRLARHPGCPFVSRLEATLSDARLGETRLLSVRATCPPGPAPPPAPAGSAPAP